MKPMLWTCLTAAACLAAVPSRLTAQEAEDVRVIRVRSTQDGVELERRIAEAIELLEADELTPAKKEEAQKTLRELAERLRAARAQGAVRSGAGRRVIYAEPVEETVEVEVIEAEPNVVVRARGIAPDGDGGVIGKRMRDEELARKLRNRFEEVQDKAAEVESAGPKPPHRLRFAGPKPPKAPAGPKPPKAPAGPKAPKAPKAANAPKAPGVVEWKVYSDDETGGRRVRSFVRDQDGNEVRGGVLRVLRDGDGEHAIELEDVEVRVLKELHDSGDHDGVVRRALRLWQQGGAPADVDAKKAHGRLLRLIEAHAADGDADEVHEHVLRMIERARDEHGRAGGHFRVRVDEHADAVDRRRELARAERKAAARLDDVTEEAELHEMLAEMRQEMREIRALMKKIRAESRAEHADDGGRRMRQ